MTVFLKTVLFPFLASSFTIGRDGVVLRVWANCACCRRKPSDDGLLGAIAVKSSLNGPLSWGSSAMPAQRFPVGACGSQGSCLEITCYLVLGPRAATRKGLAANGTILGIDFGWGMGTVFILYSTGLAVERPFLTRLPNKISDAKGSQWGDQH